MSGCRRVIRPAMQTAPIATATPRTAHASRRSRWAADAHSASTSPYSSSRANSITARPGASDHEADSSTQTPSSASAASATPLQPLTPPNGRSTVTSRSASASASTRVTGAHASGKKPPAWKPSTATSSPGSRAGSTAAALRTRAIAPESYGAIRRSLGTLQELEVGVDHQADQRLEVRLRAPPELPLGLRGVAHEQVDLGRALERVVDLHVDLPRDPRLVEGDLDAAADRVGLTRGDHEVVGLLLLEHQPHRLDVVLGVAPVALGVQVAELELVALAELDRGRVPGDLAGHELQPAAL